MAGAGKLFIAAVLAAAIALALVASSSGSGGSPAAGERGGAGGIELTDLGDFASPVHAATAPGKSSRNLLFVVEQAGTVRIIRRGKVLPQPFFDISDQIAFGGEQGLLSIAFAPDYEQTRRLYAYYTGINGDIRVSQLRRSADSKVRVSPNSLRKVIQIPHRDAGNHNGGQVAFGPDGELWLGTGDGGSSCDPDGNALNPASLLGKLLRISPTRRGGYSIPEDNPFVNGAGRDEIYAVGLRNPFRFSFDEASGTIAIGDVGQNAIEEVDYVRLEDLRGANFGWDAFEGTATPPEGCPASTPPADHVPPIHEYGHSGGAYSGCSVIGGLVVRDERLPSLNGRYIYSDICNSEVRSLAPAVGGATDDRSAGFSVDQATSFTEGVGKRVYVTSLSGDVFRLDPAAGAARAAEGNPAASDVERTGDGRGGFKAASVASFDQPVYVTGPKGADGLLFVVEQDGVIKVVRDGKVLDRPFLDIRDEVESGGERGLLSVAFSPRYGRDGLLYTYFTDSQGDIVIREFRRAKGKSTRANESSGRTVIQVPHRDNANHNGGQVEFGPDGLLYFGTGDGGSGGDPPENAQNRNSLLGKLIRIDPRRDGKRSYTVPASNPFVGKGGQSEIYSLGLRNPFRFSFDRKDGRILIGDVGQDAFEEVDYETLKSASGANFGWDAFEGKHRYNSSDASPPPANAVPPIFDYSHGDGGCTVIGGYVSRDKRVRSLYGRYLYADLCIGQIRSLVPALKGAKGDRSLGLPNQAGISSFGEDAKGRLYFTNLSTGKLYAIRPAKSGN